jgi:hypothetical protein
LHDLCERLANEQDPKKFTNLVMELNQLLGSKELRIEFHEKIKVARQLGSKKKNRMRKIR